MYLENIKKLLLERKSEIEKRFHVKKIGIFGSVVQNKHSKNSDIDLLVEFEKGHKDFFNYMRLKYYLEELFNRKVDLVIKEAVKPQLKEKIFNETVYA